MDLAGVQQLIRDVPDYPSAGIMFRDITPLLADAAGFASAIDALAEQFVGEVDVVAGVEARGFIFAAPVAHRLGVGFVPVRKPNKLPFETVSESYELEYGIDTLEIHRDAVTEGQRVLLVDDVLATGGTAAAAAALLARSGATIVGASFLIELLVLGGRTKLPDVPVHSILTYD